MSLVVLGHQGGEGTIPLAFAAITIGYGYQTGWLVGAIALLLIGLPFTFWAYHEPRIPHAQHMEKSEELKRVRSWTRKEVLRDPIFWVLLIGVLAPPFIGTTIFFHQNYLTTFFAWPPQLFALSLLVLSLSTVGCALVTGATIDRFDATFVLPYFLFPLSGACFALAFGGPAFSLFIVMVLLGVSYGIASTLFGSLWPEIYGTVHLGSVRSITISAAVIATAAGPGISGTLIDSGITLPTQMIFLGGYCLLAAAALSMASVRLRQRSILND